MRTFIFSVITFVAVLAVCLLALEIAVRQLNWLPSDDASAYDPETGLPEEALTERLRTLRDANPGLVVIGDSYVETGNFDGGWAMLMEDMLDRSVFALGFSGAAPSQYLALYRAVRAANTNVPIVVVLYVGNDLIDEDVWRRVGSDKSGYPASRRARLGDAESDTFWPCYDASPGSDWVARRLDIYSEVVQVAFNRLRAHVEGVDRWEGIARLQRRRCTKPEYTIVAEGHLFFVKHHEAVAGTDMQARMTPRLAELFRPLADDDAATLALVYDREQTCSALHGSHVTSAGPVAESLRDVGLRVMEFHSVFAEACAADYPYLPDGHWNGAGHMIFAHALAAMVDFTAYAPAQ